jgi:hypothetical protein
LQYFINTPALWHTGDIAMARPIHSNLPGPVFHEPIFGETELLPDPNGFFTEHPSDNEVYKEIEKLLTKKSSPFRRHDLLPTCCQQADLGKGIRPFLRGGLGPYSGDGEETCSPRKIR